MFRKLLKKSLILISLIFVSCGNFFAPDINEKVRGYFEYYTDNAAVEKYDLDGSYPENSAKITCLTSSQNHTLTFYVRNPKSYTLNPEYLCAFLTSDDYTFTQDSEDKSILYLTIKESALYSLDCDARNDISGLVYLTDTDSGRPFDPYSVSLHVNSIPPGIRSPVFQQTSEGADATYIVCLYFPNINSMPIHKNDTRFFYVNGSKKYFNGTTIYNTASFDSESGSWSYSDQDTRFSTNTPVYYPLENGYTFGKDENGNTLPAPENYTVLYFNTGIAPSPEETSYTFTIEDDEGLSSSIAISNKAKQLNPVSFSAEGNATYSADEDSGVYTLYISHDGLCTDGSSCGSVTIHYTVTELNGNNVFAGGSTSSITASVNEKAVLNLPKGKYKIDSYAGKNYYIASDSSSVSGIRVVQSANFYVAENGKDDENTGAKKSPFRTIQKAIDTFIQGISSGDFEADGMCNINLQTDLTVPEGFAFSENNNAFVNISSTELASATINIRGYGAARTINLSGITDNSAVKASAGTVILENLSITGIGSPTGPCYALYIDGGKVTCSNCAITNNNGGVYNSGTLIFKGKNTIYDNKNSEGKQNNVYLPYGKKIKINGDISGSKIGVSMPFDDGNKPTAGISVTFTQDYGYGSTNTAKAGAIFIADNEYSVGTSDDKEAAFMVSGGSFYSAQDFNFNLSCLDSSGNAATGFYPNVAKNLTIKPTVTRKEAGDSTRQLYLNPGNNILYTDETFETKAAGDNKVSWKAALYCYGEKHSDITVTSSASGINLTIPAISFEDTYTLKVTVTYLELSHDAEWNLECKKSYQITSASSGLELYNIISSSTEDTIYFEISEGVTYKPSPDDSYGTMSQTNLAKDASLYIPAGKTVVLSGSGTIDAGDYGNMGFGIKVLGKLVLKDSVTIVSRKYLQWSLIEVKTGGEFVLEGGTLDGRLHSTIGGSATASACSAYGKVTISGGTIKNFNRAPFLISGTGSTMTGGTFTNNGGTCLVLYNNFTMSGGEIVNNTGYGVSAYYGNFTMTGGKIAGNTKDGSAANIFIKSGKSYNGTTYSEDTVITEDIDM